MAGTGFVEVTGASDMLSVALIPLLPIVASLTTFFVGKKMWRGGAWLPIVALLGSFALSLRLFIGMLTGTGLGHEDAVFGFDWFTVGDPTAGGFVFEVGFQLDKLSIWMATLVSLLSLLIIIFSTHYLSDESDGKLRRYYAVKALFVSGMLGTVLMDNYLLMFMFWEIMGLCSYLLIGYWYHKESAARAAKKAFLTTRLGDILLFAGMIILVVEFHTLSYREIFSHLGDADPTKLWWAGLLIFGGAVGKSAQFPLDIWLPDAMEGPTTVSALIHAATMVKAGVFLVARTFPLYVALAPDTSLFVIIGVIGGVTAIYTATMALTALDIKRVLAFSTLSQLGYMFLALGAGGVVYVHTMDASGVGDGIGFTAAMLHLMNHAFFKALLFLGSASVILGMHHHQDMREMGGLKEKMPWTYRTMLIGSLSIAGIIPLSGFWSKDEVLATAWHARDSDPIFAFMWLLGIITAGLTAFYMFRMIYLTFHAKPRTEHAEHAHESPRVMTVPLMILAVFAIISGLWLVTPLAEGFEAVITYPSNSALLPEGAHAHHKETGEILMGILTSPLTYVSLGVALAGILFARARYRNGLPKSEEQEPTKGIRGLLYNRYYVTQLVYEPLGNVVGYGIAVISNWFDRKGVDGAVNGVAKMADWKGSKLRQLQNGRLTTYMTTMAIGAAVLLLFMTQFVSRFRW